MSFYVFFLNLSYVFFFFYKTFTLYISSCSDQRRNTLDANEESVTVTFGDIQILFWLQRTSAICAVLKLIIQVM